MYIQSVTAQMQYFTLQRTAVSAPDSGDGGEPQQPADSPLVRYDRVELSAWAISISRPATGAIGAGTAPDSVDAHGDEPKSPVELVADLRESIANLEEDGVLSQRQARRLNKILDIVDMALEHGRFRAAGRLMRHFAWRAERMIDRGHLPLETGGELVDNAKEVNNQIGTGLYGGRHAVSKASPETNSLTVIAGVMMLYSEFRAEASAA